MKSGKGPGGTRNRRPESLDEASDDHGGCRIGGRPELGCCVRAGRPGDQGDRQDVRQDRRELRQDNRDIRQDRRELGSCTGTARPASPARSGRIARRFVATNASFVKTSAIGATTGATSGRTGESSAAHRTSSVTARTSDRIGPSSVATSASLARTSGIGVTTGAIFGRIGASWDAMYGTVGSNGDLPPSSRE